MGQVPGPAHEKYGSQDNTLQTYRSILPGEDGARLSQSRTVPRSNRGRLVHLPQYYPDLLHTTNDTKYQEPAVHLSPRVMPSPSHGEFPQRIPKASQDLHSFSPQPPSQRLSVAKLFSEHSAWEQRTPKQRNSSIIMSPFPEWRHISTPTISSPLFRYEPLFSPEQIVPSLSENNSESPTTPEVDLPRELANTWWSRSNMSWGTPGEVPHLYGIDHSLITTGGRQVQVAVGTSTESSPDNRLSKPLVSWAEVSGRTSNIQKSETRIISSKPTEKSHLNQTLYAESGTSLLSDGWGLENKRPAGASLWQPVPGELNPRTSSGCQITPSAQSKSSSHLASDASQPSLDLRMSALSLDGSSWPHLPNSRKYSQKSKNVTKLTPTA